MAGRDAFLIAGGAFLLVAVITLLVGSPLIAMLLALVSAFLFWYSTKAATPRT